MQDIGQFQARRGAMLRSGGAGGSDASFEAGCDLARGYKEIYLPWKGFNENRSHLYLDILDKAKEAKAIAAKFHPIFDKLQQGAQKLHTRNVFQILGQDLQTPVDYVICWTSDGLASGVTGQAMRIAEHYKIRIFNLHNPETRAKIENQISREMNFASNLE